MPQIIYVGMPLIWFWMNISQRFAESVSRILRQNNKGSKKTYRVTVGRVSTRWQLNVTLNVALVHIRLCYQLYQFFPHELVVKNYTTPRHNKRYHFTDAEALWVWTLPRCVQATSDESFLMRYLPRECNILTRVLFTILINS